MTSSAQVIDQVEKSLSRFTAALRTAGTDYGPDAALLFDAAESALAGGKRMRARFCHAGWSAVARAADPAAREPAWLWDACAALEVFQAAALVHDDLIDNSDTRRGRPAAHRGLEAEHRRLGWAGAADDFGRSSAILLGDLLVAWSDDLLEQALVAHPQPASARTLYAQMRRDVTVGQFLDIAEESAWALIPDDEHAARALRVVTLKSARYSVEHPLLLGAALAGADDAQRAALAGFGRPVGVAFQLRDDLLGVFGDPAVTGKPAGDDIREGKRTLLVALTRTAVDAPTRTQIDEALGDPAVSAAEIAQIQSAMRASGAVDRVEELISAAASEADAALDGAHLDATAVAALAQLARAATQRSA